MSRSRPRLKAGATSDTVSAEAGFPAALSWRVVLGLAWFITFSVWFYSFGIPNGGPVSRWVVWSVLPFDLLDVLDPPVDPHAAPWSWLSLGQRVPFFITASLIWLGAWGLGSLVLRALRLGETFDRAERLFFAGCLGMASVSLVMLGLGLLGVMSRWPLLVAIVASAVAEAWIWRRGGEALTEPRDREMLENKTERQEPLPPNTNTLSRWLLLVVAPFLFCMLLGAMTPQNDFDVVEYHLGGPKEWFQAGRIARLPHNVYTSFPFLTEMLLLCGMVLQGDWEWGALGGQAALAGFIPLTALGLYATGRRWFNPAAGSLAAFVWLTAPWAYRISIIAYAEGGLACYMLAALAVGLRLMWCEAQGEWGVGNGQWMGNRIRLRLVALCGLLAGSAMACKYTGAVSVVLPLAVLISINAISSAGAWGGRGWSRLGRNPGAADRIDSVEASAESHAERGAAAASSSPGLREDAPAPATRRTLTAQLRRGFVELALFGVAVFVAVGPWLLKNFVETGNPVYPLAYSIFGGEGRDAVMDAQWNAAHGAKTYSSVGNRLSDLIVKLTDVSANNDWHSPLLFGLAPIALLAVWRRKVWCVWAFIGWQFLSWFWLTHHIDRFYVPMLPVVALLAGAGAAWLGTTRSGRWCGGLLIVTGCLYNAWIMKELGGFNAGRIDLLAARDIAVAPSIAWLNAEWDSGHLPRETKVLCVGEAALFHAHFPYVYNTVFDRSRFENWCAERTDSGEFRLRPPDDIRATLHQHGITHVLVNWSEILRYREPGSYGYTDFAHPSRFAELQAVGVLDAALPLPDSATMQAAGGNRRKQIRKWAFELLRTFDDKSVFVAVQVFPVKL